MILFYRCCQRLFWETLKPSHSGVFHTDLNPLCRGCGCFEVWFGLPGWGPVSSSHGGQGSQVRGRSCKLSILCIQQPNWNLVNPRLPQTVKNLSATRSLCPCFLGHKAGGKINLCFFGICGEIVAGGDRFLWDRRLLCLKYSEKRDLSSLLQGQSNLNKRSNSNNKHSSYWCVRFHQPVQRMLPGYYLDIWVIMTQTASPVCKHQECNIAGGISLIASHGQEAGHKRRALFTDGGRGDSHQKCPREWLLQGLMGKARDNSWSSRPSLQRKIEPSVTEEVYLGEKEKIKSNSPSSLKRNPVL